MESGAYKGRPKLHYVKRKTHTLAECQMVHTCAHLITNELNTKDGVSILIFYLKNIGNPRNF